MQIVIPKSDISSFMYVMLYGTVYVICVCELFGMMNPNSKPSWFAQINCWFYVPLYIPNRSHYILTNPQ